MDLEEAREKIKEVDEQMADLFVQRMRAVEAVAAYKKKMGLQIEDLTQEKKVIEGRRKLVEDPILRSYYVTFLQDMMDVSKEYQRHLITEM